MNSTGEAWRLGHRPALDGVRGFAVLLVVADHAGFIPEPAGAVGVAVFFVLSGFLISRLALEARQAARWSARRFIAARAVRLFPALLLMVTAVSGWQLAHGASGGQVAQRGTLALLYLENYTNGRLTWTAFDHTWSLAVEEQFYLLLPLALLLAPKVRRPLTLICAVAGVSLMARIAFSASVPALAYASLPTNAYALLTGCSLAVVVGRLRPTPRLMAPVALFGLALLALTAHLLPLAPFTGPAVGALLTVPLVWSSLERDALLESRPLRFAGRISYALYLWHMPLLVLTGTAISGSPALPVVLVSVLVAVVSTLVVEEPIRRTWASSKGRGRGRHRIAAVTSAVQGS